MYIARPTPPAASPERATVRSHLLDYARARVVADGYAPEDAMAIGRFANRPGALAPTLMAALDFAYAFHITGLLDAVTDAAARREWMALILSFQDDDGWFRARDDQHHGVEHATAYALGGLQILARGLPAGTGAPRLKPFTGLALTIRSWPSRQQAPFHVGLLDKVHFWRGSHRIGGIPAIIGAVGDLGLPTVTLLGLEQARAWLDGWALYWLARVDRATGSWRLAPRPLHWAFDRAYRSRHDPLLASLGGAVHLYWIFTRLGLTYPQPHALIRATAPLIRADGLYEGHPYCIDLDAAFLLGRSADQLDPHDPTPAVVDTALERSRRGVLGWLAARGPADWHANSHTVPGALAAVAEADRRLEPDRSQRWADVFDVVWWL